MSSKNNAITSLTESAETIVQQQASTAFLTGGIAAIERLRNILGSEVIRAIQRFGDERRYLDLGYDSLADFLDNCPQSPMSRHQYYDRLSALQREGDAVFDLFNSIGVSLRVRKSLGSGVVEIDGEQAIIHSGEDEIAIPLDDRTRLVETLSAIADANAAKSKKIEHIEKSLERKNAEIQQLQQRLQDAEASARTEFHRDAHAMARVNLGLAFNQLAVAAARLTDTEKNQLRDLVLEEVGGWMTRLRAAYLTSDNRPAADLQLRDFSTLTDDQIWNEELPRYIEAALDETDDNDAELIAAL